MFAQDVQLIMPTVIILVFTIVIMITVIPYAFSSVLKQMEAVRALEAACEFNDRYQRSDLSLGLSSLTAELRRSISAASGPGVAAGENNITQTEL